MIVKNGRGEQLAGRQGHAMTIEVAPRDGAHKVGTAIAERAVIPARQPGPPRRQRRGVWLGVGLIVAAPVLRNRRFRGVLTVGVIVLMTLAWMGWKVLARTVRDLSASNNARPAGLEDQLRRQRIAQAPDGAIMEGTVISPQQPDALSRQRRAVLLGVGLVAAGRVLRSRRFDEQAIVAIFALGALAQTSWKELAGAVRDLIAWDNTRLADLERQQRRQREAKTGQSPAS